MGSKQPVSIDPIKYLSNEDIQLARVIKAVGQYSIKVHNNAFQSLVESIIFLEPGGYTVNKRKIKDQTKSVDLINML